MDVDALVEMMARAICEAGGRDQDVLTWWNNGECMEPYGDAWTHYIGEARAALRVAVGAIYEDAAMAFKSAQYSPAPYTDGRKAIRARAAEIEGRLR